jgi:hypothetical protein
MQQSTSDSSFGEKLFDATCKASISAGQPQVDAIAEVWSLGLLVKPNAGSSVFAPYTDAARIEASNYHATLATSSGQTITISQLGAKFDNFAQKLTEGWGNALARALLMEEPKLVYEAPCYYSTSQKAPVPCRARIYETAMVVLPSDAPPIRFPFSYIEALDLQSYRAKISTSDGGAIELSKLGVATQFFVDKLRETMKATEAASIETVRAMIPSVTFDELQRLGRLMVEGRAAYRKDVDEISPGLWPKMEKCVELSPLADYYRHLSGIAETGLGAVGLRKSMETVYVWVMMPVMGTLDSGGNAVALEVTSETGHATYLFWVMPRGSFPAATRDRFVQEAGKVVRDLNEAVVATGFRREPIYLSEDQLNTPEYSKYLYAAGHLEPLKLLRERFFARIMHNTFEQWKADFADALLFNTTEKDDSARWSKNVLDFIETPKDQVTVQASSAAASAAAAISPIPLAVEQPAVPPPAVQALNAESAPIGYMAERSVTLSRMEGDERGNVKLMLHDPEFDYDIWLVISGDDAAKLGAFPGAKLKIAIQKA